MDIYDVKAIAGTVAQRAGALMWAIVMLWYTSMYQTIPPVWVWFGAAMAFGSMWAFVSLVYTPYLVGRYLPPEQPEPYRGEEETGEPSPLPAPLNMRSITDIDTSDAVSRARARADDVGVISWVGLQDYAHRHGRGPLNIDELRPFAEKPDDLLELLREIGAVIVMRIGGGPASYSLSSQATPLLDAIAADAQRSTSRSPLTHSGEDILNTILRGE